MIYDKKVNISRYSGLSKNIDTAIHFIETADLQHLPKGRTTIDGDEVFVNHFSYTTAEQTAESLFEDHMEYLDLHFPLSGAEKIAVSEAASLKEVEKRLNEDAIMYTGTSQELLPVSNKEFLIVYPGEAHLPKLVAEKPVEVDKLVFKIRL